MSVHCAPIGSAPARCWQQRGARGALQQRCVVARCAWQWQQGGDASEQQHNPWRAACVLAATAAVVLAAPPQLHAATTPTACTPGDSQALHQQGPQQQQQYQQEGVRRAPKNLLAEIAGLFGGEERDPIDAFTLYGTTFKKFLIEKLDGEKVVARQRGFTVDTCVASARAAEETPSFQFLPIGEKVAAMGNAVCSHAEGAELKPTCVRSCEQACAAGLGKWEAANEARTGFVLLDKDRTRLVRSCTRECATDCTRPGKAYDFSIPFRK